MRENFYWAGDVVYMRWLEGEKVVRVAKSGGSGLLALYPTHDKSRFSFELVRSLDDPSNRNKGPSRGELQEKDPIMLKLLDGADLKEILRYYQPSPIGEDSDGDNRYTHYFAERGSRDTGMDYHRHGTFHICDDMQERKEQELENILN